MESLDFPQIKKRSEMSQKSYNLPFFPSIKSLEWFNPRKTAISYLRLLLTWFFQNSSSGKYVGFSNWLVSG